MECALGLSVNVIGMMKMGKTLYEYNGVNYTAAELLNKLKKKSKKCKVLCSSYVEVSVKLKDNQVTLFFSRFGKRGKWHVILCTDKKLDYRKMMELYQIRWTIEIFFKESKQYLNLGKSQSEDFGGQIADITISMIQHMLLTLRKRFGDYETRGEVFRHAGEQLIAFTLDQRLWKLCLELIQLVIQALELTVDSVEELISKLVKKPQIERLLIQQKLPLVA